jgi:hypothetical protein
MFDLLSDHLRGQKKLVENLIRICGFEAKVYTVVITTRPVCDRKGIHSGSPMDVRKWNPVCASCNYRDENSNARKGGPLHCPKYVSSEKKIKLSL